MLSASMKSLKHKNQADLWTCFCQSSNRIGTELSKYERKTQRCILSMFLFKCSQLCKDIII